MNCPQGFTLQIHSRTAGNVIKAIQGHFLAKAVYEGLFKRHSSVLGELAWSMTSRILLISEKRSKLQSEILPVKGGYFSNISAIRFAYFLAAFSGLCEIDPIAVPRQTIFSDVTSIRSTTVVDSK